MGLADLLMAVGARYGSAKGIAVTQYVTAFMQFHAMRASIDLAEERGPFPAIEGSMFDPNNIKWISPQTSYPDIDWNVIREGIAKSGIR